MPRITELNIYPVKSMRAVPRTEARVTRRGLERDRRYLVVDPEGLFVSQREEARLALVEARLVDGGVELRAPGAEPIVARPLGESLVAKVWSSTCDAIDTGREVAHWLSSYLGRPVRLVHQPDDAMRPINLRFAKIGDGVSFADGYPILLTNEASLAELNRRIAEERPSEVVPMSRFRPNVVIEGAEAFAEDAYKTLRIGDVRLRLTKLCDRCVMTTIDQTSAATGKEPLRTLAKFRRWDEQVWFGVNLVPETEATIRVGDPLEILA